MHVTDNSIKKTTLFVILLLTFVCLIWIRCSRENTYHGNTSINLLYNEFQKEIAENGIPYKKLDELLDSNPDINLKEILIVEYYPEDDYIFYSETKIIAKLKLKGEYIYLMLDGELLRQPP